MYAEDKRHLFFNVYLLNTYNDIDKIILKMLNTFLYNCNISYGIFLRLLQFLD